MSIDRCTCVPLGPLSGLAARFCTTRSGAAIAGAATASTAGSRATASAIDRKDRRVRNPQLARGSGDETDGVAAGAAGNCVVFMGAPQVCQNQTSQDRDDCSAA